MTTTETRPQTWDHLKSRKQPSIKKIKLIMSGDVAEEYDRAQNEFNLAEFKASGDVVDPDALAQLEIKRLALREATAAADADSVTFKFKSLGRKKYDALVDKYPPTPKQIEDAEKTQEGSSANMAWDAEKFPMALIAACIIEPEMTFEQVQEMWDSDEWSASELQQLFFTALAANQARRVVELGNV